MEAAAAEMTAARGGANDRIESIDRYEEGGEPEESGGMQKEGQWPDLELAARHRHTCSWQGSYLLHCGPPQESRRLYAVETKAL